MGETVQSSQAAPVVARRFTKTVLNRPVGPQTPRTITAVNKLGSQGKRNTYTGVSVGRRRMYGALNNIDSTIETIPWDQWIVSILHFPIRIGSGQLRASK